MDSELKAQYIFQIEFKKELKWRNVLFRTFRVRKWLQAHADRY